MAAETKGTAHLYGISGTVTNATVLSFNKDSGFDINGDPTYDETGVTIERRYDDRTVNATITIRMQALYTQPSQGDTLTYDSVTYEIVTVGESQESRGFRTLTLTLLQSEGITY